MINLDELLKELESNKEIEFERLKKEFVMMMSLLKWKTLINHL